jgi:hypothetical protein
MYEPSIVYFNAGKSRHRNAGPGPFLSLGERREISAGLGFR